MLLVYKRQLVAVLNEQVCVVGPLKRKTVWPYLLYPLIFTVAIFKLLYIGLPQFYIFNYMIYFCKRTGTRHEYSCS